MSARSKQSASATDLSPPVSARDHALGPHDAPATLVEYGDYECPHCAIAHEMLGPVLERFEGSLRFVYRNFPLREAHPNAENAAEVAESAAEQDRFWPMHDKLYENQRALSPQDLLGYASGLGLDEQKIREDLIAHRHHARVREDFTSGIRSGVSGTPTFFLNGRRLDGLRGERALVAAIEEVLGGA
jgi:protein-disulfide isomerase